MASEAKQASPTNSPGRTPTRMGTLAPRGSAAIALAVLLLTGGLGADGSAGTGGELEGVWREEDGKPVTVVLRFHREQVGQGRMSLRLGSEGERYVGEYARVGPRQSAATLRRFYLGWTATDFDALRTGPLGFPTERGASSFETFRERHRGEVIATLAGNRGGRMRCRFKLEVPEAGLAGGATGACQTDDAVIVSFPKPPSRR